LAALPVCALCENLILNGSVEVADPLDPDRPQFWSSSGEGTNTRAFVYDTNGHDSARSVRVEVSDYVDGYAHWTHRSASIIGGTFYTFSAYIRGTVEARTMIRNQWKPGAGYYGTGDSYRLKRAVPNPFAWTKFSETFFVPQGVQSVRIHFAVEGNGTFSSDDYTLEETAYPPNSNRQAMISIMADDEWLNFKSNAVPVMNEYGFKGTFYVCSGRIGEYNKLTEGDILGLHGQGHEIAAHSVTHGHLTSMQPEEMATEIAESKAELNRLLGGEFVTNFATPFGDHDNRLDTVLREQGFDGIWQSAYGSNRNLNGWFNYPENFHPLNIRTFSMKDWVTMAQFRDLLDLARDNGLWLTLTYHQVVGDRSGQGRPTGSLNVSTTMFRSQMRMISDIGIRVETVQKALKRFVKGE